MQIIHICLLIFLTLFNQFLHKNFSYRREGTAIESSPHMLFSTLI